MSREFTEGEMAIIEKTVYATIEKVEDRLCEKFAGLVTAHANTCPVKAGWKVLVGVGALLVGIASIVYTAIAIAKVQ